MIRSITLVATLWAASTLSACGTQAENQESSLAALKSSSKVSNVLFLKFDSERLQGRGDFKESDSTVTIDLKEMQMSIFVSTCPRESVCVWAGPIYTAKNLEVSEDGCGALHYKAASSQSPRGGLIEMKLTDYSKSICEYIMPNTVEAELKVVRLNHTEQYYFIANKSLQ